MGCKSLVEEVSSHLWRVFRQQTVIYYQMLPEPANGDSVSVLSSLGKLQSISGICRF